MTGESSAAAQHLSGGAALPVFRPPHTAERGVKGRPTLVQNVETLANLALLARHGCGLVPAGRLAGGARARWC